MKELYDHQRRFIEKNPDRALLVWETGTGKSLAACEWLKLRPKRKAIVICPKTLQEKWKRDLTDSGAKAVVVTTDGVKKIDLAPYDALVIDEAQNFAAPLFDAGKSQRSRVIYEHVRLHPDTHVLLLTATPVRSTPWNIHTLACYLQHFWPVKAFKEHFFYLTDMYGRYHYELKKEWQKKVRPYVLEIADVVLMKDCADVPPQVDEVIRLPEPPYASPAGYMEPSAAWHDRHRNEQGSGKTEALRGILDGYRKAIVVCFYTEQLERYSREFSDRQVFVLQGATKNPDEVIEAAKEAHDCVFLIQASMGAGFDAAEFSVVIFASMSFRYVDYVQMKGRVKRIHNLHENLFIHLLSGKCDEAVYAAIMAGHDFDVHHQ